MALSARLGLAAFLAVAVLLPVRAADKAASDPDTRTAIFAGGCFWCVEQAFDAVDGVVETVSGFTGGVTKNPSYRDVVRGGTRHAEAVRIRYDPSKVTYSELLVTFWRNVDPTDGGGQFCDRGDSYRSAIFVMSEEEKQAASASKKDVEKQLGQPVATEILSAGAFYEAEEGHQDYYLKNPARYIFYKWNCGRAQRLEQIWGPSDKGS